MLPIAKKYVPPEPLALIVAKLLAKTAEERYQSALGLRADLERCAREWTAHGSIAPFALAEHDVSDRFMIPQKLYGRAREVDSLLAAFEQACQGQAALLTVSGYSGIGKTSLIGELDQPIVRQRGYFCAGKFDQVMRGKPLEALTQALRSLVRQWLGESEAQLTRWRTQLSAALGANGGVLAEVIPEIELMIGAQPAPSALGATESLNRFQRVFQQFIGAVARPEHPLVIFLDDLQWADAATLSLLQPLLTTSDIPCLLLIGAYRDNEVDAAHPLTRTLAALETAGASTQNLTLGPLLLDDLSLLMGDALHLKADEAAPLAQLVSDKTAGNPFFVTQFLKTLRQENYLTFDYARGRWGFQLEAIAAAPLTDNVIDLMTQKIRQLPARTQQVLTLAACIGNPFDRQTLAVVSEQSAEAVAADLSEAINEGLVLSHSNAYAFLHDRVQQAAYELIPAETKQQAHLTLGRLLWQRGEQEPAEEKLFDLVHHLNLGNELIVAEGERLALAQLNLKAGSKAKAATAYAAALGYLRAGLSLLDETHWQTAYELCFALHLEAAECLRLCSRFDEAETEFTVLLPRAQSKLDEARIYNLRIMQSENLSHYDTALALGRECLALFGVMFPDSEAERLAALEREVAAIEKLRQGRPIAALSALPVMADAEMRMVMNILTTIWSSAYISGEAALTRLFSATLVRLSLEHGNAEESAYGYATHTITMGPVLKDYEAAYEFGRLALQVNEQFNDRRLRAKVYQQFHAHANFWRQPLHTCLPYAREASRSGFESGDMTYGVYGAFTETWAAMFATQDLAQFVRDYAPNLTLFKKLKVASVGDGQAALLNWARALQGQTRAPLSLITDEFDEEAYSATYRDNPFFSIFALIGQLQLAYTFDEPAQALALTRQARALAPHLLGMIWPVMIEFWHGLALAANYETANAKEQPAMLRELEEAHASLSLLAEHCAENFRCPALLLAAEIERLAGRELAALNCYESAISYAAESGMIQYQALANELCARLWLQRGQPKTAAIFMTDARAAYAQWGATAKVAALERRHAALLNVAATHSHAPRESEAGSLDLFSVTKAAQAIAGEIEMETLLRRLLHITLENAGAVRGALLLERAGEAYLYAEGTLDTISVQLSDAAPLNQSSNLPHSVINYVRHTSDNVVLPDATRDATYANDAFVLAHQPRSILCTPILAQGRLLGTLYLENAQASDVFTTERVKVCQVLASQAAISLENARLYAERVLAERRLRALVEGTAQAVGRDFFRSMVRHLADALPVKIAFVTECANVEKTRARTLAFWDGKGLADTVEYNLKDTTCERVYQGETCFYAREIQKLFPQEAALVRLNGQSYIGLPMHDTAGELIGHLAVIDDAPMDEARGMDVLKIFAARAGAELQRMKAEAELREALAEVERLKNQLHAENVYLQEEILRENNFEEIIGTSPALLNVLQQLERVAPTDATVLVLGETGTGKELLARAIHNLSARRERPLIKVNCGAISAGLVESELFGHVKGAFTGALDKRVGRFELADGGTLFLDEVGELPPETQVKLLRVLQEGEFEPVGSSKTLKVDVRIIAATNRNLESEIAAGRFRADLFYRLNVLPLHNPPLRERREDIPALAAFFASRFARRFDRPIEGIAHETITLLQNYAWPGNIRELQNLIERGVVMATGKTLVIEPSLLPSSQPAMAVAATATMPVITSAHSLTPRALDTVEREHILAALAETNWVIEGDKGAAKILNLHPNTLRSRMKKMGIQRPTNQ